MTTDELIIALRLNQKPWEIDEEDWEVYQEIYRAGKDYGFDEALQQFAAETAEEVANG